MTEKVRTCLWFEGNGMEAVEFYVSLLPNSKIERIFRPDPSKPPLVIDFSLGGAPYQILNAGPASFRHSEAASISVLAKDQAETDRLWEALTADGGSEGQCGWLKDRYGVSWQIVPEVVPCLLSSNDHEAAGRAFQALMGMKKINAAALQAAFN